MDASASAHDEAVWSALRNTGIARKAGLHAHAMLCALEGGELVIPAPLGVSPALGAICLISLSHMSWRGPSLQENPPVNTSYDMQAT